MRKIILFCLCLCEHIIFGATPTEIRDALHHKIDSYRNLQFEYSAETRMTRPQETMKNGVIDPEHDGVLRISKNIFKILDSDRVDVSSPWIFWKQSLVGVDNSLLEYKYSAFDGKNSLDFSRVKTNGIWSIAQISPFDTKVILTDNFFVKEILFSDLNGLCKLADLEWKTSRSINNNWKIVREGQYAGYKTFVLISESSHKSEIEREVEVIGAPIWLIARREVRNTKGSASILYKYKLNDLFKSDLGVFPGSGEVLRPANGFTPGIEFKFTMTNVSKISEESRKEWIPKEWPKGTRVYDHIKDISFDVPHNPEEAAKLLKAQQAQNAQLPFGLTSYRLMFLLFNLAVLAGIAFWLYRRWKIRRGAGA